jgi:hypothetical protein
MYTVNFIFKQSVSRTVCEPRPTVSELGFKLKETVAQDLLPFMDGSRANWLPSIVLKFFVGYFEFILKLQFCGAVNAKSQGLIMLGVNLTSLLIVIACQESSITQRWPKSGRCHIPSKACMTSRRPLGGRDDALTFLRVEAGLKGSIYRLQAVRYTI